MHAQQFCFSKKEKFDAEKQPTFDHTFQPPPPDETKKTKKITENFVYSATEKCAEFGKWFFLAPHSIGLLSDPCTFFFVVSSGVRGSQKTVGLLINIGADFTENSFFSQGSRGCAKACLLKYVLNLLFILSPEIGQIWLER